MKTATAEEVHTNLGISRPDWLWLEELAISRARKTGGRSPRRKFSCAKRSICSASTRHDRNKEKPRAAGKAATGQGVPDAFRKQF